jgi:hypothetical protein
VPTSAPASRSSNCPIVWGPTIALVTAGWAATKAIGDYAGSAGRQVRHRQRG